MSAIQQALRKLDTSIQKLEGTVEYFEELNQVGAQTQAEGAQKSGQPDMFTAPPASNTNSAEIAERLDSAIGKVEKILADGSSGK